MNLLAQNRPRTLIPGRVVLNLLDDPVRPPRTYFGGWYSRNRAKVLTRMREYQATHRDDINARRRERYAANPAKYKAQAAKAYQRHAEKIKARQRAYYARNKCVPG